MCAVGWCRGILRPPCGQCETNGSAGVNVAGCALEQCVPQPREMWGYPGPHRSEFTSVIYGFVLLLSTPTLVCVLQTPGCISGPTPVLSIPRETSPGGSHLLLSARGPFRALGLQEV